MTHRASVAGRGSYSGQPACTVQLQLTDGATSAGMFAVIATNPMSPIGEFGPENTSATAADTAPVEPLYGCGLRGPPAVAGPTVTGPSGRAEENPLPIRLQPSPFRSTN